jgi:dihydroneopterin aldolase
MPSAADATTTLLIRDLVLPARIGVHAHEREGTQRIAISLEAAMRGAPPTNDRIREVLNYELLVDGLRALVADRHYHLVETLAERAAAMALAQPTVTRVTVAVVKLDVYTDVAGVGVRIERARPSAVEAAP